MTYPLLHIHQLSKSFPVPKIGLKADRPTLKALQSVSLSLHESETLALVGESGCGKSTLAQTIFGLIRPNSGQITFKNTPLFTTKRQLWGTHTHYNAHLIRQNAALIFQNPHQSLNPKWSAKTIIEQGLKPNSTLSAAYLLQKVGLDPQHDLIKYPHQFSGGQCQRIAIARALAQEPKFIVCDEITASLDLPVQTQILTLMKTIQTAQKMAYLFITHDLSTAYHMADRVAVMYGGRIIEHKPTHSLFHNPQHPYTRLLIRALDQGIPIPGLAPNPIHIPDGCLFADRCPYAKSICHTHRPHLKSNVACHGVEQKFLPKI
jgi:peptide/nickel transport system ATP-binding protein